MKYSRWLLQIVANDEADTSSRNTHGSIRSCCEAVRYTTAGADNDLSIGTTVSGLSLLVTAKLSRLTA